MRRIIHAVVCFAVLWSIMPAGGLPIDRAMSGPSVGKVSAAQAATAMALASIERTSAMTGSTPWSKDGLKQAISNPSADETLEPTIRVMDGGTSQNEGVVNNGRLERAHDIIVGN